MSLAALAALAALAPHGSAQTIPIQPQPVSGISVLGEGIVLVQPNVARITLGVDVFDQSLAAGIAETDIRTVNYTLTPQYDQQGNPNQPVLRGYRVQNMVQIKSTNIGGMGALIDDVVSSGATHIFGITFESDNMEALKNQARDQAMANARAKAEQLARDSGVTLGRPTLIEESDTGGVTPQQQNQAPRALAATPSTPIEPGQLQVATTVRVVWSIQ
jgi:uncharacterized protein YggE